MAKCGKQSWVFKTRPHIAATGTVVGPKEGEGPLGRDFDAVHQDSYVGQASWEKGERVMAEEACERAVKKAGLQMTDMDIVISGDLLNQIVTSSFSARTLALPYLGIFSACATSMEGLALAASLVDSGYAVYALATTSSHNSTAERQFRYPTEYGGQKPPTAQCTVTGAGAVVVAPGAGAGAGTIGPVITHATIGKVIDMGIKNPWEMGPAMAPAAADTIMAHFRDTGRQPQDYDLILTGDLGRVGHRIAFDLLAEEGYQMGPQFQDCGILIYDSFQPEVFSGGSGCACSAVVTYGHVIRRMMAGDLKRVLIVATGSLLSPLSTQQGESIPCIAHAVAIEWGGGET